MKKQIALVLALILCLGLCSCERQSEAAKSVDDQIEALGEITLDSKQNIIAAEQALYALGEEDYNQVKNREELKTAREVYNRLVLEEEVLSVENAINAIGEVTLDSEQSIAAARYAYKKASKEAQNAVGNLALLESAEAELETLRIKSVEDLIDSIGVVTLDSQRIIEEARTAYNSLSGDTRAGVKNVEILETAETILEVLFAEEVEKMIDDIGDVTLESGDKIQAARKAYDDLLIGSKTLVSNTNVLNDAEKKFAQMEMLAEIERQDVRVISTKYEVQSTRWKTLYPDLLQAVLKNDTSYDIKDVIVAFVAWDKNNLPVKIKPNNDIGHNEAYIQLVRYGDINLIPGGTYGKNGGFGIDEDCEIKTFKAIVYSYETFEGITWENPLFEAWCELYEGVKLK